MEPWTDAIARTHTHTYTHLTSRGAVYEHHSAGCKMLRTVKQHLTTCSVQNDPDSSVIDRNKLGGAFTSALRQKK